MPFANWWCALTLWQTKAEATIWLRSPSDWGHYLTKVPKLLIFMDTLWQLLTVTDICCHLLQFKSILEILFKIYEIMKYAPWPSLHWIWIKGTEVVWKVCKLNTLHFLLYTSVVIFIHDISSLLLQATGLFFNNSERYKDIIQDVSIRQE